jgi:hypothetical protein
LLKDDISGTAEKPEKGENMRCFRVPFCLVFLVMGVMLNACSGVRPLQKGETLRCPSCGAEFTVEQGVEAAKNKK